MTLDSISAVVALKCLSILGAKASTVNLTESGEKGHSNSGIINSHLPLLVTTAGEGGGV